MGLTHLELGAVLVIAVSVLLGLASISRPHIVEGFLFGCFMTMTFAILFYGPAAFGF